MLSRNVILRLTILAPPSFRLDVRLSLTKKKTRRFRAAFAMSVRRRNPTRETSWKRRHSDRPKMSRFDQSLCRRPKLRDVGRRGARSLLTIPVPAR